VTAGALGLTFDKLTRMPTRARMLLGMLTALACVSAVAQQPASMNSVGATAAAVAAQPATTAAAAADPRVAIAAKIPGTRVEDLHASPVPGLYQLNHGADVMYVTADGKYALYGDLFSLANKENLTEDVRRDVRAKLIASIPESEMVIFGPSNPKYTVTVFTDVDCAYCRELHSQIADYNHRGIRVRYIAYPRSGPNTESWTKAEQVWCSKDRNAALTAAKLDQPLQAKACPANPVAKEYALGKDFSLSGTPAIVMPDGELVTGYLSPALLAQHLRESQGK
jgi:thiol:disulfide interchange protein DsbC